jgi:hypothetical protein
MLICYAQQLELSLVTTDLSLQPGKLVYILQILAANNSGNNILFFIFILFAKDVSATLHKSRLCGAVASDPCKSVRQS